jgi:hypothetical protein
MEKSDPRGSRHPMGETPTITTFCWASVNACFGRTFAVPGRSWKAAILPNPALQAVPTRVSLIVRLW